MEDSDLQSGALIGSNEDILTEILVRLPATSILRFKSVSKHWKLLLSDSRFTHRYDNKFSKSLGILAGNVYYPFDVEYRIPSPFRAFDCYFNRSNVEIRQSCNGLLLCSTYHNRATEYYVFNPTTKQLAIIPSLPKNIHSIALAYDRTYCAHYKIVCICALEPDENIYQIQIYSSEARKWNTCIESFSEQKPRFREHNRNGAVYWNGAVHWAPFYSNFLYYKLDVEQLHILPLPEGYLSSGTTVLCFGESRGHLHIILHKNNQDDSLRVNVYEMLSDHLGWFVKYQVELDGLLNACPEMVSPYGYNFEVVDVVRGKEEEDAFMVLLTTGKIIRYNVHDKSFKVRYSDTDYLFEAFTSFHRYVEALSSF